VCFLKTKLLQGVVAKKLVNREHLAVISNSVVAFSDLVANGWFFALCIHFKA